MWISVAKPGGAVPQWRRAVAGHDPGEVGVARGEFVDRAHEDVAGQRAAGGSRSRRCRQPATAPVSPNPPDGSGSKGRPFRTAEPRPRVLAERRPVVAALLEDDQATAGRRHSAADLVIDVRGQGEVADRVESVAVEAERHDDDRCREPR